MATEKQIEKYKILREAAAKHKAEIAKLKAEGGDIAKEIPQEDLAQIDADERQAAAEAAADQAAAIAAEKASREADQAARDQAESARDNGELRKYLDVVVVEQLSGILSSLVVSRNNGQTFPVLSLGISEENAAIVFRI